MPLSLVLHGYWNLAPGTEEGIGNHWLEIVADTNLPVDEGDIPTGESRPVAASPVDFREARLLGDGLRMLRE